MTIRSVTIQSPSLPVLGPVLGILLACGASGCAVLARGSRSGGAPGEAGAPAAGARAASTPLRAVLAPAGEILGHPGGARARLEALKGEGFNAVAAALGDDPRTEDLDRLRQAALAAGVPLYLWLEVGRSPSLAARRPEWVAGMGSHEDWRERFPGAPRPEAGQRVGMHPWTPLWYREVLEDRQEAILRLLRGRGEGVAGVFLDHVQGAPSACGCGNDQCRWTADYRMAGGPERVERPPAALLITALRKELPGVLWIPVLVTECEEADQEKGGTGYCGGVHCFSGLCWRESSRELEEVASATAGPLAFLLATGVFRRDLPRYSEDGGWPAAALRLLSAVPPKHKRAPLSAGRVLAVIQEKTPALEKVLAGELLRAGAAGVIAARKPLEEGWEPRLVPVSSRGKSVPGSK